MTPRLSQESFARSLTSSNTRVGYRNVEGLHCNNTFKAGQTVIQSSQNSSSSEYPSVPIKKVIFYSTDCRYQRHLEKLDVDPEALYRALLSDAEVDSPNWDLAGRQANIWKKYGG